VGLHLWSGDDYFLSRVLDARAETTNGEDR
jgi:hypothetical protein